MSVFLEYVKCFIVGGAICVAGQLLIDLTKLTPARILTSYVVAGVVLTGLGIYGPIVNFAGSGATVPLTGFGYALAKGVEKGIAEKGWIGIITGGLTATAAGITAAVVLGLIAALVCRSKTK